MPLTLGLGEGRERLVGWGFGLAVASLVESTMVAFVVAFVFLEFGLGSFWLGEEGCTSRGSNI